MRYLFSIILTLVLLSNLSAQDSLTNDSAHVIMKIRGFDYLKSDSVTNGANLNNPEILDTIASYLKANPNLKVELHYHGSCNSSSKAYWDHSTKRQAKGCMYYLISKGIDEKRIRAFGKGINNLITDCNCGECSENELYQNHRLEVIKIE